MATKKELAQEIAEYILYFEEDDFKFYCDEGERENHVYLKAYEYIYGPKAAETLLNEERETPNDQAQPGGRR